MGGQGYSHHSGPGKAKKLTLSAVGVQKFKVLGLGKVMGKPYNIYVSKGWAKLARNYDTPLAKLPSSQEAWNTFGHQMARER